MRAAKNGFTLFELVVVTAIIIMIATASFTISTGRIISNDLNTKVHEMTYTLKLAQMRSITRYKDDTWGVYFNTGSRSYTLFKGATYAARNTSYDSTITLPSDLSFTSVSLNGGGSEVLFDKLTGKTSRYGTIVVTPTQGSAWTITVNSLGVIDIT